MYFNEETEKAVIAFQVSLDPEERKLIYIRGIAPAFEKMVENLINIHKFTDVSLDELKCDCIAFLYETLPKWDSKRGTAAFSYFNVVGKHFLINRVKSRQQRARRGISMDDETLLSQTELRLIELHDLLPSQDSAMDSQQTVAGLFSILNEVRTYVETPNELAVINSIITMFENIDTVDFFTRTAAVIYIKELSGLSSKQLSTAMHNIKRLYREIKGIDLELFG